MRTALIVQGMLLVSLAAAGCAKTAATSTAAAPPPSGTAMTVPTGPRSMEGGTRQAAAVGSTTRQRIEGFKVADTLADVHFEFDRYDLTAEATQALDANAAWLKANPRHLVLIEGHCDERGTAEYNLALGERRAKSAMNYLVSNGIEAGRITTISYGKERPVCSERAESCWSRNRNDTFLTKEK
jgi:peptidoglycan-associated lipoprotein